MCTVDAGGPDIQRECRDYQECQEEKKVSLVDRSENIVRELSNSLDVVSGRDVTYSRRGQDSSHKKGK